MDIYEVIAKLYENGEKIDRLAKSIKVLDDLARHAETAKTYNRCVALQLRLHDNVKPLGDEFDKLKNEYDRLIKED